MQYSHLSSYLRTRLTQIHVSTLLTRLMDSSPHPYLWSQESCVLSLKRWWRQSVHGASTQYQVYCDCGRAGNATEPLLHFRMHYKPQTRHHLFFFSTVLEQWKNRYFSFLCGLKPQWLAPKLAFKNHYALFIRHWNISSSEKLQRIQTDFISWYMGLLLKTPLWSWER